MNAPDTNLLLFAYDLRSPFHLSARAYLQEALTSEAPLGLPILCVHGFVRIATSTALGESRLNLQTALSLVDTWLSRPNVRMLHPGLEHWSILKSLATSGNVTGPVFTDASIAAIVIEHGAVLHTCDCDFARFPNLKWLNPLAASEQVHRR